MWVQDLKAYVDHSVKRTDVVDEVFEHVLWQVQDHAYDNVLFIWLEFVSEDSHGY